MLRSFLPSFFPSYSLSYYDDKSRLKYQIACKKQVAKCEHPCFSVGMNHPPSDCFCLEEACVASNNGKFKATKDDLCSICW